MKIFTHRQVLLKVFNQSVVISNGESVCVKIDGNQYFPHNISDGSQGYMYTGWHQIEGKWYYFRENGGEPMGSILTGGTTPDGYETDAQGV